MGCGFEGTGITYTGQSDSFGFAPAQTIEVVSKLILLAKRSLPSLRISDCGKEVTDATVPPGCSASCHVGVHDGA